MYQRRHLRSPDAAPKLYRFLRLPWTTDVSAARDELVAADLPWFDSQWKWHLGTRFCVLRGGPATERPGDRLTNGRGVDAPCLSALPATRALLDVALPARAVLAWVGLSPPGARIHVHVDNTRHWDEHHRVHLPLVTSPGARLGVEGRFAHLPAGTCWALNNSRPHAGLNDGPARLHLVVDLAPTAAVEAWLRAGTAVEGEPDPRAWEVLRGDPLARLSAAQRADEALMARLLAQ